MRNSFVSQPRLARVDPDTVQRVSSQSEFKFGAGETERGYTQWLTGRRMAAEDLARRIHLPLGYQVEVWLYGGVRLRGKLRLREEHLFIEEDNVRHLELVVDRVAFAYREMESCVRLD
jgi:hypothetical protein